MRTAGLRASRDTEFQYANAHSAQSAHTSVWRRFMRPPRAALWSPCESRAKRSEGKRLGIDLGSTFKNKNTYSRSHRAPTGSNPDAHGPSASPAKPSCMVVSATTRHALYGYGPDVVGWRRSVIRQSRS